MYPMKLAPGYYYHLVSGVILVLLAFTIWLNPEYIGNVNGSNRNLLLSVLVLWGGFRLYHARIIRRNEKNKDTGE